jgi:Tannase and feruloyl esterase
LEHYNYYNAVTNTMGGLSEVQSFYRFFPYPGNGHCGVQPTFQGGFGANVPAIDSTSDGPLFQALVNWVEHNVAPDTITATNSTRGTRPICKYPDTLHYNGSGNIFAADNFTCEKRTRDPLMRDERTFPDLGQLGP